jgi:hypothetical protein
MADSENIIPTSYREAKEALKMAGQIRRASIVVQDYSGQWKLVLVNNRYKLPDDLHDIEISENDGYVHINDNYGPVQRAKVQLSSEDLLYFARILSEYVGADNPVCLNFNNPAQRVRSLISIEKKDDKPEVVVEQDEDRSGLYEVQPFEFYCYFKRFHPAGLIIEQDVGAEIYKDFIIHITINDKNLLKILEPVFRKSQKELDGPLNHLAKNKPIELKLVLKPKILEKIKYKMYDIENINTMLQIRNPLGKGILNNISNYTLEEVKYL